MNITNKQQMYKMLAAGEFGNTIPQYFSIDDWDCSNQWQKYNYWGVRTMTPGGPCKLNCHLAEVEHYAEKFQSAGHKINISCMVDQVCNVTMWMEVMQNTYGVYLYGIEYPSRGSSWREMMPYVGEHWIGVQANQMLKKHLNSNSYDDLMILFDRYPDHVVELSALEQCFGTVQHRNTVVWEVRKY